MVGPCASQTPGCTEPPNPDLPQPAWEAASTGARSGRFPSGPRPPCRGVGATSRGLCSRGPPCLPTPVDSGAALAPLLEPPPSVCIFPLPP